jgi:hypothetical protein
MVQTFGGPSAALLRRSRGQVRSKTLMASPSRTDKADDGIQPILDPAEHRYRANTAEFRFRGVLPQANGWHRC